MIVFGQNNFSIKKVTPKELGITSEDSEGFFFEIRQKYFHLFWIPTFGIGKLWVMRNQEDPDLMYEMSDEVKRLIHTKFVDIKSPWYTYIGLIIIGIGAIAVGLS